MLAKYVDYHNFIPTVNLPYTFYIIEDITVVVIFQGSCNFLKNFYFFKTFLIRKYIKMKFSFWFFIEYTPYKCL